MTSGPQKNVVKYLTLSCVVLALCLEVFAWSIPLLTHFKMPSNLASVIGAAMTELTNEERAGQDLGTLAVSPKLNQAAEMKASDMATGGYFAHTSPAGKTPWYWLDRTGYAYDYAGENLALNFSDSKDVVEAWMNSPTHRANIVKGNYTEIGTGVAEGVYQGRKAIFVAQVYAHPLLGGTTEMGMGASSIAAWEKLLASPTSTAEVALYAIFALVTLALILYIFIKSKDHEKALIRNGLIVLFLIALMFAVNYYVKHRGLLISDSIEYSHQSI